MPEICRFYGIIISLYWRDHSPPHLHFSYGSYQATINIADRQIRGTAPQKVIDKMNRWLDQHEHELTELWEKAQQGEKLLKLKPLI